MSSERLPTPPSTLDGIKKLAKTYKREHQIPHHQALDRAAIAAGFNNIRDAQSRIESRVRTAGPPGHIVYLSAYWRTRERPRAAGLEVLRFMLPKPAEELVSSHELRRCYQLNAFRFDARDHLEARTDRESQELARSSLIAAARALRFMAVTGLRPYTTQKQWASIDVESLPGKDHVSAWIAPGGAVVKLDEPYAPAIASWEQGRAAWAAANGLSMVAPSWRGLYYPDHARPYLVARNADLTAELQKKVEELHAQGDIAWEGDTLAYHERFLSPARASDGKAASRRVMPAYPGTIRAGAIAYGGRPGVKGFWRPAKPMPLPLHERASRLLHDLCISRMSWRARSPLNVVRSDLENWVYGEHREAAHSRNDLYYGGDASAIEPAMQRDALSELIGVIQAGYDDCAPRRQLLAQLERAAAHI